MTSRSTQVLTAAAILVTALALGCSSDTATSSTAGLSVRFVPSPTGVGRFAGDANDEAELIIFKIAFAPSDPALVELLGQDALVMRFGDFDADLAATDPAEYAPIALPPGTYVIKQFQFRPPTLQDGTASQAAPACIDRVARIDTGPFLNPNVFELDENDGYQFTVQPGQTKVDIVVDVPGLIASYQAAFTCEDSCGGGNACLTAFDADAFRAAFLTHVSIH
jgi:hypothetical protein